MEKTGSVEVGPGDPAEPGRAMSEHDGTHKSDHVMNLLCEPLCSLIAGRFRGRQARHSMDLHEPPWISTSQPPRPS